MKVHSIHLFNIRTFEDAKLNLSKKINVLVGPNNSGKSTIIKSLSDIQYRSTIRSSDVRKGATNSYLNIELHETNNYLPVTNQNTDHYINEPLNRHYFQRHTNFSIPQNEPQNYIFPFFSHRKVSSFDERIGTQVAQEVSLNIANLPAKLSTISASIHPKASSFKDACEILIGFPVGNIASPNGQVPGVYVNDTETIPLTSMGDGVASLVAFLYYLFNAKNKLFLIEEPENDIHPKALKKLLEIIKNASAKNQFVISTHSNIVVKSLGSLPETKIFSLKQEIVNQIPTTKVSEIYSLEDRRNVLEELGYEFHDEDSFNAWLFLEEATSERFIRDIIIPWFTPKLLGKIRTYSCRSVNRVKNRFDEFNSLFSFLNLDAKYKDRAWIIVDDGENEKKELDSIRKNYVQTNGWCEDNFIQLKQHDFESYYPMSFEEKINSAIKEQSQDKKRDLKKNLINEVIKWCLENEKEANQQVSKSAAEVIGILKKIEEILFK